MDGMGNKPLIRPPNFLGVRVGPGLGPSSFHDVNSAVFGFKQHFCVTPKYRIFGEYIMVPKDLGPSNGRV